MFDLEHHFLADGVGYLMKLRGRELLNQLQKETEAGSSNVLTMVITRFFNPLESEPEVREREGKGALPLSPFESEDISKLIPFIFLAMRNCPRIDRKCNP